MTFDCIRSETHADKGKQAAMGCRVANADVTKAGICYLGDCSEVMRFLIGAGITVQCVVTSPPYWGLRDYGVAGQIGLEPVHDCLGWATGARCGVCHVCRMIEVFALVRDLLADDGVLWLNYGDSYYSPRSNGGIGKNSGINGQATQSEFRKASKRMKRGGVNSKGYEHQAIDAVNRLHGVHGLKPKDLVGMPWRVALALQADGWYLRQDLVWHKPNPMPESVTDRCTKAHEYIFMMSKNERYYFDQRAIAEPCSQDERRSTFRGSTDVNHCTFDHSEGGDSPVAGSIRVKVPSGWDTAPGSHGSSHREGRGSPEYREVKRSGNRARKPASARGVPVADDGTTSGAVAGSIPWEGTRRNKRSVWTIATQPCPDAHFATFPEALAEISILAGSRPGDLVLDPFMGSGTVAAVAQRLGRRWLGCEINPVYQAILDQRVRQFALALHPPANGEDRP